jgi:hypothetical protein
MSDSDSAQRRRPPTIDLTAKEVETSQPTEPAGSSWAASAGPEGAGKGDASHGGSSPTRRATPYVVSGLIGAVAVAGVVAAVWFTGLAPQRSGDIPQNAGNSSPAPDSMRIAENEAKRVPPQVRPPDSGAIPQRGNAAAQNAYAPPPVSASPPPATLGDVRARMAEAQARLEKLRTATQAPPPDAGPPPRASEPDAQTKALGDAVAALTRRVDEIAASTRDLAAQVKAASAAATAAAEEAKVAAQNKAQSGDIDQFAKRLESIESSVKALTADAARDSASADDHVARAAVAAAVLAAVVERGAPFSAELASVTALGAEQDAIAALAPFAAGGLPSNAALSRELIQLLPALRQASATSKENSLIARLEINAQKLVRITRADATASDDDPSSIISHIELDARNGDVAGALAEISRLPEQARSLAADWVKKAQAREAAVAASRRIAANAAAALAKPAQQ